MTPIELLLLRRSHGLTQAEFGSRLVPPVTRLTVCNWERAKFAIPRDIMARVKGLAANSNAPKLSLEDRGTLQAYSKMRHSGDPIFSHHANIVTAWHNAGFTPSREAMVAIAAEWPDILNPPQEN